MCESELLCVAETGSGQRRRDRGSCQCALHCCDVYYEIASRRRGKTAEGIKKEGYHNRARDAGRREVGRERIYSMMRIEEKGKKSFNVDDDRAARKKIPEFTNWLARAPIGAIPGVG